jgi:DNA-binding transcriptional ArsR family regulator
MPSPLDDVAFLSRSENRVAVMRALADGPHSRQELVETTDGSRVTVGRVLSDFEARGWVRTENSSAALTTQGRLVIGGLDALLARLRAVDRLDPVLPWFEVDRLDVPVESFVDAETTVPTAAEPHRHHRRIGTVGGAASTARMYSQGVTSEALGIHLDAVREAGQRLTLLLTDEAVETAREDDSLGVDLRALVSTDAVVGSVDEALPVPFVGLFDGRCVVGVSDDRDLPVGIVESDDSGVVAWADRTLDRLEAAATPVEADTFRV